MHSESKQLLLRYFSERDFKIFFGARSELELRQLADLMRDMSPQQATNFKMALASLQGERMVEANHGGRTH